MLKFDGIHHGEIFLTGDENYSRGEVIHSKIVDGEEVFVRATSIEGIFTYGCKNLKPDIYGHGVGYVWSSRAAVMNKEFDLKLIECCYVKENSHEYRSCSIDLDHLYSLLEGTEYEIDWKPYREDDSDRAYRIVKKQSNDVLQS